MTYIPRIAYKQSNKVITSKIWYQICFDSVCTRAATSITTWYHKRHRGQYKGNFTFPYSLETFYFFELLKHLLILILSRIGTFRVKPWWLFTSHLKVNSLFFCERKLYTPFERHQVSCKIWKRLISYCMYQQLDYVKLEISYMSNLKLHVYP